MEDFGCYMIFVMVCGRFYFFIFQLECKVIFVKIFMDLFEILGIKSFFVLNIFEYYWEIKFVWLEYCNGKWLFFVISLVVIFVNKIDIGNQFLEVFQFQFRVCIWDMVFIIKGVDIYVLVSYGLGINGVLVIDVDVWLDFIFIDGVVVLYKLYCVGWFEMIEMVLFVVFSFELFKFVDFKMLFMFFFKLLWKVFG